MANIDYETHLDAIEKNPISSNEKQTASFSVYHGKSSDGKAHLLQFDDAGPMVRLPTKLDKQGKPFVEIDTDAKTLTAHKSIIQSREEYITKARITGEKAEAPAQASETKVDSSVQTVNSNTQAPADKPKTWQERLAEEFEKRPKYTDQTPKEEIAAFYQKREETILDIHAQAEREGASPEDLEDIGAAAGRASYEAYGHQSAAKLEINLADIGHKADTSVITDYEHAVGKAREERYNTIMGLHWVPKGVRPLWERAAIRKCERAEMMAIARAVQAWQRMKVAREEERAQAYLKASLEKSGYAEYMQDKAKPINAPEVYKKEALRVLDEANTWKQERPVTEKLNGYLDARASLYHASRDPEGTDYVRVAAAANAILNTPTWREQARLDGAIKDAQAVQAGGPPYPALLERENARVAAFVATQIKVREQIGKDSLLEQSIQRSPVPDARDENREQVQVQPMPQAAARDENREQVQQVQKGQETEKASDARDQSLPTPTRPVNNLSNPLNLEVEEIQLEQDADSNTLREVDGLETPIIAEVAERESVVLADRVVLGDNLPSLADSLKEFKALATKTGWITPSDRTAMAQMAKDMSQHPEFATSADIGEDVKRDIERIGGQDIEKLKELAAKFDLSANKGRDPNFERNPPGK